MLENLDPTTLAIGAAIGGGVGTLATIVVLGLIIRFGFRGFREFDALRTDANAQLRLEVADLRRRLEDCQGKRITGEVKTDE